LFGLPHFENPVTDESRPEVGHVGCVAEVVEVQPLEDGRSNVLTVGVVRYRLADYVEAGEPYLVGRVEFFEDEDEDGELLARRAARVSELFGRIARSVRAHNDDRSPVPELPADDAERLSFLVAAAMEMENADKQELREMRSSAARLSRLSRLLVRVVDNYEARARAHTLAKGNGHGGRKIDLG